MTTTTITSVGNATTAAVSTGSSNSDIIPKSVITICILIAGFLVGVAVAKLANYCYNRSDVPDNASDISEHTKGLLRMQLALMKFGKSGAGADLEAGADAEEQKRQQLAAALNMWKMKAITKAAQRAEELAAADGAGQAGADGARKASAVPATAAGARKGGPGTAGKAGANAKPKAAAVRPKKLFPYSIAGVVPSAAPEDASGTSAAAAAAAASNTSAPIWTTATSAKAPKPSKSEQSSA